MSYIHLTIHHRNKIEALHAPGFSARYIAAHLHVHHVTVSRELKRVPAEQSYTAEAAQRAYEQNSHHKGRPNKATPARMRLIQNRLQQTWSPEQIAGRETQLGVSFKTIYTWLYNSIVPASLQTLRRKGTSRKPREARGTFRVGRSIHDRPNRVENRTEFGHWELDTVVSSRGKSEACVATFFRAKASLLYPHPNGKSHGSVHVTGPSTGSECITCWGCSNRHR